MKIGVFFVCIFVIILLGNIVNAAQVIEVNNNNNGQTQKKEGLGAQVWNTLTSPLFITILIVTIFLIIVLTIFYYLIKFIIRLFKGQTDVYEKLKNDRIKNAIRQRRYKSTHSFRIRKNIPIRLIKKNEKGENFVSRPIAYYRGDYLSHDGTINLAVNFVEKTHFWFIPDKDLILIPNKDKITFKRKEGKEIKDFTIDGLPKSKDLIIFNEEDIIIRAEAFDPVGNFYIPVLRLTDNEVMDLSIPTYASIKNVISDDLLYTQSNDFIQGINRAISMNPEVKVKEKFNDPNKDVQPSTEVPQ